MYQQLDSRHLESSAAALAEVCAALNPSPATRPGRPLEYRIGHFEHGSLLTHLLHTFTLLPVSKTAIPSRNISHLDKLPSDFPAETLKDWAEPHEVNDVLSETTAELVGPLDSDVDHPLTSAVVANQSVEDQIFAVLVGVATLLGRTKVVDENFTRGAVDRFAPAAEASDERAKAAIRDAVRARGWRRTAEQLMSQARLQGIQLRTSYHAPLLSASEVSSRVQLARFTYNSFPVLRAAVDKTVALTARGMRVRGESADDVMRFAEDLIDTSHSEQFFAHAIRDAVVCGNGIVDWGADPTSDLQLVEPSRLVEVDKISLIVRDEAAKADVRLHSFLHLTGSDQIDCKVGMSTLEPFVQLATQRSLFLSSLLQARTVKRVAPASDRSSQAYAGQLEGVAVSQLAAVEAQIPVLLGSATTNLPDPPPDLYFPGHERMAPAFSAVRISNQNDKYGQVES